MKNICKECYRGSGFGFLSMIKDCFSSNWRNRFSVADNVCTPASMLIYLSKDNVRFIRYSVAKNLNTPTNILRILEKDSDWEVRLEARRTLDRPYA